MQVDSQSGWCHAVAWSPTGEAVLQPPQLEDKTRLTCDVSRCTPCPKVAAVCQLLAKNSRHLRYLAGSQLCFTSHGSKLHVVSGIDGSELLRSGPLVQDQSADSNAPLQCHLQPQPYQQDVQLRQLPFKVGELTTHGMPCNLHLYVADAVGRRGGLQDCKLSC